MMFENISIEHYLYNTGTMEISFGSQGQIPVYLKQLLKIRDDFTLFCLPSLLRFFSTGLRQTLRNSSLKYNFIIILL